MTIKLSKSQLHQLKWNPDKLAYTSTFQDVYGYQRDDWRNDAFYLLTCRLPIPPSVNHYWKKWRNRIVIGQKGRDYRMCVAAVVGSVRGIFERERISVSVTIHRPDKRRADLDNVCKALLDSLQHAGLYDDDSQIDELSIKRGEQRTPGMVVVDVRRIK